MRRGSHARAGNPDPNLASSVVLASSQYWSINDNASLSMGAGIDMTIASWANVRATPGSWYGVGSKDGVNFEYALLVQSGLVVEYSVSANGTTVVSAVSSATIALNTWAFLVGTYDGTNIRVYVNAGTPVATAFSTDVFNGASYFSTGYDNYHGTYGTIDLESHAIWKSTRGAGGALSAAQITALYNQGRPLSYREAIRVPGVAGPLQAYWEWPGNGKDSHVWGNHLFGQNAPTFTAGKR